MAGRWNRWVGDLGVVLIFAVKQRYLERVTRAGDFLKAPDESPNRAVLCFSSPVIFFSVQR